MAIGFASIEYKSRSSGGNAVRTAAYNARQTFKCERTGEVFAFPPRVGRGPCVHHEVLAPAGAPASFSDAATLWNEAEFAERRKDSQVAREMILALPADTRAQEGRNRSAHAPDEQDAASKDGGEPDADATDEYVALDLDLPYLPYVGITPEDRILLARSFAQKHFVSKGLAVQINIHAPDDEDGESGSANWHAHLLITTRRIGRDGFERLKARDLDPVVKSVAGRGQVVSGEVWGELWRAHQNEFFRSQGSRERVHLNGVIGQMHVGPVRMRRVGSEIVRRAEAVRQAAVKAACDPALVLETLTKYNATFTDANLGLFLGKQLGKDRTAEEIARVHARVLAHADVLALFDSETGEASERLTTRQVRDQERAAIAAAASLAKRTDGAAPAHIVGSVMAQYELRRDDQAFTYANGGGRLKIIEGRPEIDETDAISAVRVAHERAGWRVVDLAETSAVSSALFNPKNEELEWDLDTVVIVNKAAMLSAPILGELLAKADGAGAKLMLVGGDPQMGSIERSGLFFELVKRHGSAKLAQAARQDEEWRQQAASHATEYQFEDALKLFQDHGAITWKNDGNEAHRALVQAWARDTAAHPAERRFVFAYENAVVDKLNDDLHEVRRGRLELVGDDVPLRTVCIGDDRKRHGRIANFAKYDRVQFTDTDEKRGIFAGVVGTISSIAKENEEERRRRGRKEDEIAHNIVVKLDGAGHPEVTWNESDFQGFRHGYAGMYYKGYGKALDQTYLYHTDWGQSAPSYVALTRQRRDAKLFVSLNSPAPSDSRDTAPDIRRIAKHMEQDEVRTASLAWATRDELSARGLSVPVHKPAPAGSQSHSDLNPEKDSRPALAEISPNLPRGKLGYAARQERKAKAERNMWASGLVREWDRLIDQYRNPPPNPDDTISRDRLMEHVERLAEQASLKTWLQQSGDAPGLDERPLLRRIVDSAEPKREIMAIMTELERAQAAQRPGAASQAQPLADDRPDRQRGRGSETRR